MIGGLDETYISLGGVLRGGGCVCLLKFSILLENLVNLGINSHLKKLI